MREFNDIKILQELSSHRSLNKVFLGQLKSLPLIIKYFYDNNNVKNEDFFYKEISLFSSIISYFPYQISLNSLPPNARVYEYIIGRFIGEKADEIEAIYYFIEALQKNAKYPITDEIFFEYRCIYESINPTFGIIADNILRNNCSDMFLAHHDLQIRNMLLSEVSLKIIDPEHSRLDFQYVDLAKLNFLDYNSRNYKYKIFLLFEYLYKNNLSLECLAIVLQVISFKLNQYIKKYPNNSKEEHWIIEQVSFFLSLSLQDLVSYLKGLKKNGS